MRSNLSSSSSSSSSLSFFSLPSRLPWCWQRWESCLTPKLPVIGSGARAESSRAVIGGRQTLVSSWAKNSAERRRERSLHEKEIETLGVFLPHASLCCTQAWLLLLILCKPLCQVFIYLFIYVAGLFLFFCLFSITFFKLNLNFSFREWSGDSFL